ncbi:hypothetical protein H6F95_28670 [Cyanobacteria bacterium FACHB-471]|nr:hypothetical protein [Cyanobacteria bacterium FACHB-471]
MNIRTKRLANDFKELAELVSQSDGKLTIISTEGNPPYCYVIQYRCKGIERLQNGNPLFRYEHQVKIYLESEYPRSIPKAEFLTPIFHPNVWRNRTICFGSYWTVSETLAELVLRISKLIQYSKDILNLNSPANSVAKAWAEDNLSRFPVGIENFKDSISNSERIIWNDLP